MKIITDIKKISSPCDRVNNIEEGKKIGNLLLSILFKHKNGAGLSANQIGINKSVCVINVKNPIILINPIILEAWDQVTTKESCLSFPNKFFITNRKKYCLITDDLYEGKYQFGDDNIFSTNFLESICVQHEIDHLFGITSVSRQPISNIKPNDIVVLVKNNEKKFIKYKRAKMFLQQGWKLFNDILL